MKKILSLVALLLLASGSFSSLGDTAAAGASRRIRWEFPRLGNCHEGMPFSDGVTGVLVWGGDGAINVTLGRADLWDHRGGYVWTPAQSYTNIVAAIQAGDEARLKGLFQKETPKGEPRNPYMLPLGRVVVNYDTSWHLASGTLDPFTGLGELVFERLNSFPGRTNELVRVALAMPKASRVFAMDFPKDFPIKVSTLPSTDHTRFFAEKLAPLLFEKAVKRADGFDWQLPADKPVSVDFVRSDAGTVYVATRRGESRENQGQPCLLTKPLSPFDALRRQSVAQWSAFWAEGAKVHVPDPVVQRLFDYGMYRFGAMTDPDGVPAGLQGPWLEDDRLVPWNGDYHFNINVQECYEPAFRGGHFKNLLPLFRMVLSWRPRLRENARLFVGLPDGYALPHSVDDRADLIGGFWSGTIDHASTAWVADMMWRYVKYSGDVAFLKDGAYDFMKGAMRVYRAMMEEREGRLSLPIGPSPEWGGSSMRHCVGRDPSFQLAAAHRLTRDLIAAAALLGEKPEPMWLDVEKRLPVYNAGPNGFYLFGTQELSASHRHHSHMAGLYPFDVVDMKDAATRRLANATYANWVAMGTGHWTGWCVPWASILNTHFGSAVAAVGRLHDWDAYFCDEGHGSHHNAVWSGFTSYDNGRKIMQMDGQCMAAAAVMELMVHEVSGKAEYFRGCPADWKDVSFENIRLSDGRKVSGRRLNGAVMLDGKIVP